MIRFRYLFLLLMLLVPVVIAQAQGAPEPVQDALASLSAHVGREVTLGGDPFLSRWTWAQEIFPDTSLGCPQNGQVYSQVQTTGYKVELTYNGVLYDYRVPLDRSYIIFCDQSESGEVATPTAAPDEVRITNPLCPEPEPGETYMPSRLIGGNQGRVTPGLPNNVRGEPSIDSPFLGEIPGGGVFTVVTGPQCRDAMLWWQINYDGLVGWTSEGRDGEFWLEPFPPAALPLDRQVILAENVASLTELSRIQGNFRPLVRFSPDGSTLAVPGALGGDGVWLYTIDTLGNPPRSLFGDEPLLSLDFKPDGTQVLLGGFDGTVRVWNLAPDAPLVEALFLQSHASDARAVAFHPGGQAFAVAGSFAQTTGQVDIEHAILLWEMETISQQAVFSGHTGPVMALDFSPDGLRLASASGDETLRFWDIATETLINTVEGDAPLTGMVYSPDGLFVVVGSTTGTISLIGAADGSIIATTRSHDGVVTDIAYNADGSLFASASEDSTVRLWDRNGVPIAVLQGTGQPVRSVAFSPDGTLLAVAADDHTVRLWGVRLAVG